jgi:hypothetical protein
MSHTQPYGAMNLFPIAALEYCTQYHKNYIRLATELLPIVLHFHTFAFNR